MARAPIRWTNRAQPQTLQIAVILLYLDAVIAALFGALFSAIGVVSIAASAGAGYGIANERKWGYGLGVAIALLPFLLVVLGQSTFQGNLIGLLFAVARLALLLHPESRDYQRIWFK